MCIIKAVKSAMEPTEHHRLVDPFGTVVALDQRHAEKISVSSVGVHIGAGLKTA